jgi:hypothetical protein
MPDPDGAGISGKTKFWLHAQLVATVGPGVNGISYVPLNSVVQQPLVVVIPEIVTIHAVGRFAQPQPAVSQVTDPDLKVAAPDP